MTGHKIRIPGFRLDKHGKPVWDDRRLDVSARLKMKGSKRVRPVRKTQPR